MTKLTYLEEDAALIVENLPEGADADGDKKPNDRVVKRLRDDHNR